MGMVAKGERDLTELANPSPSSFGELIKQGVRQLRQMLV
jgi:hypothetical protein